MRLFAAIVPPSDVLEQVSQVVSSVGPPTDDPSPRRGLLARLSSRQGGTPAPPTSAAELDPVPTEMLHLPVAGFGNVTLGDSRRLAAALRTAATGWEGPTVHFGGGKALEFPGDESVWATLDGDVDELMAVAREVPLVVQQLSFFVDRRQFRPWMSVGTITPGTSAPYLERLVAALDGFRSRPWEIEHISLMRRSNEEGGGLQFEELERLPLARG